VQKTRLGIIGCGGISCQHLKQFVDIHDRLEVTATVDIIPEKANAAAESLNARCSTDYREVLDDCDAVLIALPHNLHHSVGLACLEAGMHVLMEKPLANTEKECLDLIRAANQADRVLMVAYCMRFNPLVLQIKEIISKKTYGDIFQVSIWTEQHTQYEQGSWLHKKASVGGGQFFSHGCHYIDLLLWYLGEPLQGVHLGTNYGTPWMEGEGTSNASLRFVNGPLGYHFGTWGTKGTRLGYSIHAHCTEGMIEANLGEGKLYAHTKNGVELISDISGREKDVLKHTDAQMKHFLDCVQENKRPITNGPESLQGLRVIWRLYEADEKNIIADLRGLGFDQVDSNGNLIKNQNRKMNSSAKNEFCLGPKFITSQRVLNLRPPSG